MVPERWGLGKECVYFKTWKNLKTMKRYIILNEGHPPFSTDYFDPENHEPADGSEQTVIDLATMKYRRNYGDNAGEWFHMEEDHL